MAKHHISTNIDFEVRSPKIRTAALAVVVAMLISFTAYQFYVFRASHREMVTCTAVYQTIYRDITADAFIIRNESYIENPYSGTVVPAVNDGSKVSIGDSVASVYASSADAMSAAEYESVLREIAYYENIASSSSSTLLADINLYETKVQTSLLQYLDCIDFDSLSGLYESSRNLRKDVTKRQIAVGGSVDVSAKLTELYAKLKSLETAYNSGSLIKAAGSGFYVSDTDGYEKAVDFGTVTSMSFSEIAQAMNKSATAVPSNVTGKLITDFNWYLVCSVPDNSADTFSVGSTAKIVIQDSSSEVVKMTVAAMTPTGDGSITMVLKCDEMNSSFSSLRHVAVKLRAEEYSGYSIDAKAVRTVDGEVGVYVQLGNVIRFRKINIIYSDENTVLSRSEEGASGYLMLYDEIITEGTDLYDGKIIT